MGCSMYWRRPSASGDRSPDQRIDTHSALIEPGPHHFAAGRTELAAGGRSHVPDHVAGLGQRVGRRRGRTGGRRGLRLRRRCCWTRLGRRDRRTLRGNRPRRGPNTWRPDRRRGRGAPAGELRRGRFGRARNGRSHLGGVGTRPSRHGGRAEVRSQRRLISLAAWPAGFVALFRLGLRVFFFGGFPSAFGGDLDPRATVRTDSFPAGLKLLDVQLVPFRAVKPDAHTAIDSYAPARLPGWPARNMPRCPPKCLRPVPASYSSPLILYIRP